MPGKPKPKPTKKTKPKKKHANKRAGLQLVYYGDVLEQERERQAQRNVARVINANNENKTAPVRGFYHANGGVKTTFLPSVKPTLSFFS